jgi:hypothetical protein
MLVPLIVLWRWGRGQLENTSRPGPAISIFPLLEKLDGLRFESKEVTAMMEGELAGAPVGAPLLFSAAATISKPRLKAILPALV